ncbi:leucine--tRNA ligase [Gammaproteobacteria bacterium]|nr:leucine--tRNA ligase [Gammaproteobacteria bacterium]
MSDSDYNPSLIEKIIQKSWKEGDVYRARSSGDKEKFYCLSMFPYPSGKLHMGHVRNYTIGDVISRFKRLQGFNVMQPMGWDAFGLPAENAAIENNVSPKKWTNENIESMKVQLDALGFSYDWSRELNTSAPDYFRWEQWFFIKLLEAGLVERKEAEVNWDPIDQTVLANEQVIDGKGWRSGAEIERKKINQYFLKITEYADELLDGLEYLEDWPNQVKLMQKNWIGKSKGLSFKFSIAQIKETLEVFTTRPDTIFGATYCAIAVDHPLSLGLIDSQPNVKAFIDKNKGIKKTEAAIAQQEKIGIDTGLRAIHPITNKEIPIWVANFVLMEYGTGAVMCVPGHDQRDYEFAKRYNLPIVQVIQTESSLTIEDQAVEEKGILMNSSEYDGLTSEVAFEKISKTLSMSCDAQVKTNYRLRDWGISRQRYWGCPIPMIHCKDCGNLPVPLEELPVELPEIDDITTKGLSLSGFAEWQKTPCPECSKPALRETDTFDTFFESSWYAARFASQPSNSMLDAEADYWLPVDHYIGGIEHAILHLLYARFFNLLLRDQKLIKSSEPFKKLLTQGMVLSDAFYALDSNSNPEWVNKNLVTEKDGQLSLSDGRLVIKDGMSKMSKSKLNGVDPNIMIEKYGADTVRLYMMFTSPPEQSLEWSDTAIEGSYRFLRKVWNLTDGRSIFVQSEPSSFNEAELALRQKSHKTLKKVTHDFSQRNSFNTAIAGVMELLNAVPESFKQDTATTSEKFCLDEVIQFTLKMLSPITPHISLYLWKQFSDSDGKDFELSWPSVNEELLKLENFQLIIQVNGKVRGKENISIDATEELIQEIAMKNENVKKSLANASIKKVIYIKEKLINFVI